MDIDKQENIISKYPIIFQDIEYIQCGNGWYNIIDILCSEINNHLNQNKEIEPVIAQQVKNKFGGLRFYYYGGDDIVGSLISMMESLSNYVCHECGRSKDLKEKCLCHYNKG